MDGHLQELQNDYVNRKLVPFIGAGFSVPFKVPTWENLIRDITDKYAHGKIEVLLKGAVRWHLEINDYWGAIDEIKKYASVADQDIQKVIVTLIKQKTMPVTNPSLHNYSDLAQMNFKLYLTTNYENILHEQINCEMNPILLKNIEFSSQDIFDEKRICHLHGYTSDYGSIVISRNSYENLYNNEKYGELLKAVSSNKRLLFMGFSFEDKFVGELIKDYKRYLNGTHYILLENPSKDRMKTLREEYGLITIPYDTKGSSHEKEIRKILNQISGPLVEDGSGGLSGSNKEKSYDFNGPILGASFSDYNKDLSNNLFYKKLKLENINTSMIELSSIFYVASEKYIRKLEQYGLSIDVIEAILFEVFTKYKESYITIYKNSGDSIQLLKVVHENLAKYDFGRYAVLFKDNKSNDSENKGLIHLLAEDELKQVWWGVERLNEYPTK